MNETFLLRSGYDGLDISILVVRPDSKPIAVLQLAHGMRGCKERFLPFMEYMSAHGVVCVANDHRGHGGSVKKIEDRGYMYDGGHVALVEDMRMVTDWAHAEFPGLPVFLLGHSMGSLAVRNYMKRYDADISGVIICGCPSDSPLVSPVLLISRLLCLFNDGRMKTGIIQDIVSWAYNRRFASEGRNAWTCSDPAVRKDFAENPSCTFVFTANGMRSLLSMMKETYSRKGWRGTHADLPVYFISGADDPCMRGEAAFHASAQYLVDHGYNDVTSAIYTGMRHEVLNEIGKEMVWEDVLSHINSLSLSDN